MQTIHCGGGYHRYQYGYLQSCSNIPYAKNNHKKATKSVTSQEALLEYSIPRQSEPAVCGRVVAVFYSGTIIKIVELYTNNPYSIDSMGVLALPCSRLAWV